MSCRHLEMSDSGLAVTKSLNCLGSCVHFLTVCKRIPLGEYVELLELHSSKASTTTTRGSFANKAAQFLVKGPSIRCLKWSLMPVSRLTVGSIRTSTMSFCRAESWLA